MNYVVTGYTIYYEFPSWVAGILATAPDGEVCVVEREHTVYRIDTIGMEMEEVEE